MKTPPRLLLVCLCAVLAGCSTSRPPDGPGSGPVVLDNDGGFAHQGRRIVLQPDGRFTQTLYTDVRDPEHERKIEGTYQFSEDRKQLTLVAPSGTAQVLHRVPHGGKAYWVKSGEQELIHGESEEAKRLRQVSLRTGGR